MRSVGATKTKNLAEPRKQSRLGPHLLTEVRESFVVAIPNVNATTAWPDLLRPGLELGGYRLRQQIGLGGMAEVWRVERGDQSYALKALHPDLSQDPEFRSMFRDEIALVRAVDHPNVVGLVDAFEANGRLALVMEWIEGCDLHTLRLRVERDGGWVPLGIAVALIRQAAAGLYAAHELLGPDGRRRDLVHRDVSPQNIMVSCDGAVKLVDFGVAKARARQTRTAVGYVKGRVGYMAPEQAVGRPLTARADVFALGVVLWELLSGRRLFTDGEVNEVKMRPAPPRLVHTKGGVPVPAALDRLVQSMLRIESNLRPALPEVIDVLGRYIDRDMDLPSWCRSVIPAKRRTTAVMSAPGVGFEEADEASGWALETRTVAEPIGVTASRTLGASAEVEPSLNIPICVVFEDEPDLTAETSAVRMPSTELTAAVIEGHDPALDPTRAVPPQHAVRLRTRAQPPLGGEAECEPTASVTMPTAAAARGAPSFEGVSPRSRPLAAPRVARDWADLRDTRAVEPPWASPRLRARAASRRPEVAPGTTAMRWLVPALMGAMAFEAAALLWRAWF